MIEIDMEAVKALYMQMNEEWHLRNLDEILVQLPGFILQQNVLAVEQYWNRFCTEEAKRLGSRARIMEQYGIEEYPHSHKGKERAIFQQIQEAKEMITQIEREQMQRKARAKRDSTFHQAIAHLT